MGSRSTMNMSWQLWVVLAIAGGLIGNAAWAALCGATRLVDRRILKDDIGSLAPEFQRQLFS